MSWKLAMVLLLLPLVTGALGCKNTPAAIPSTTPAAVPSTTPATVPFTPPVTVPSTTPAANASSPGTSVPEPVSTPGQQTMSDPEVPELLFWDGSFLSQVRKRIRRSDSDLQPAAAKLRRNAEAAVTKGPFSVMYKKGMPPSGDKHDYLSLAAYWWPDPDSSDGKPYVRRDGQRNPEADTDYYDKSSLRRMISSVSTLGLAYYLFDEDAYGTHAAQLLRTWFIDEATRMNPNMQYAQGVPGKSEGRYYGIIDTVRLLEILDAVSLLDSSVWSNDDQQALESWLRSYLAWLQNSPFGRSEAMAKNNHGTWYDAQVIAYALFIGETTLPSEQFSSTVLERIGAQIEPDGRQPRELRRTRSLNYSLYNLEAFISLALLGEHIGVDLWNFSTPDGRSIRKALDFVTPYLAGEQWPYPDLSTQDKGFASYLCRAAIRYQEEFYIEIDTLLGQAASTDRLNLLCPKWLDDIED